MSGRHSPSATPSKTPPPPPAPSSTASWSAPTGMEANPHSYSLLHRRNSSCPVRVSGKNWSPTGRDGSESHARNALRAETLSRKHQLDRANLRPGGLDRSTHLGWAPDWDDPQIRDRYDRARRRDHGADPRNGVHRLRG